MQTIINLLGKMPDVHKCQNFVDVCAQSNISICCVGNRFCCLFSFFFFFTLNYAPFKKGFLYFYVSIDAVQKNNAMTSCYEGQPERLEFPSYIPCLRNCKHRLASSPGGYSTNFYTGRLYIPFSTKKVPLSQTFY